MIALDLDDTLLRSDLTISFRTRNAIKRAGNAGILTVLASGRVPATMEQVARLLGMHKRPGYLICNNGTTIQESHTGSLIYEIKIPREPALLAYDLAAAEGFSVQIYENDVVYISRFNELAGYDQKLTGLRQVVVENFREMVAAGVYKLLIPGDPMILRPLATLLRAYIGDAATLFTNRPYFLEVLPPATDKGAALAWVAQQADVPREAVLAIGDSLNDEAMIRWAGVGVAMVNGDSRIKNIADMVTNRSNDDDGIADFIERYILGKEPLPQGTAYEG
ncbi:MAG: Cof-type HAD-IIB family hydrolase [Spirochaetaceae bacterium]|jgi:Cof subfamily protein (haloacid dehalogenase superfamily)|nr:Cof-type HAD-IIB family hydrolase [Spirochaetaceae bacterium]